MLNRLAQAQQMLQQRLQKLGVLSTSVGRTTLFELWPGVFPNKVRVFAKAKYTNPTGSHYDRVYSHLFRVHLESMLKDRRDIFVEVSSGNAAASFVWFCRQLDLRCAVILPNGLPRGFLDHIIQLNPEAELDETANYEEYVCGAVAVLRKRWQASQKRGTPLHVLNHSRDHETLLATRTIADEAIQQLDAVFGVSELQFYIAACGNGSTIIGPGRALSERYRDLRVIGFEPEQAPVVRTYIEHGIYDPKLRGLRHFLFGTGVWGVKFPFLHDPAYGLRELITDPEDVLLIDKKRDEDIRFLAIRTGGQFGRTSLAAMSLAHELSQKTANRGANMLVLLYDRGAKYDGLELP